MGNRLLLFFVLATCSITSNVIADDHDWWEFGHFFQIYPRSFQDGDGSGVGDLQGILSRLPYLKSIDVTGVWLSPIFQSPMKDFGYDIKNFREIDSTFGTMDDFDQLSTKAKELDIKLILDFVPNHSSDQHEWFIASSDPSHPEHEKYKDYYIWNKGKQFANGTRAPPSNWIGIFRGSAWTWVETRQAYYLHQFLEAQPDLNYRNPAIVEEMKEILRFWLRKGVSGFRCDAVPFLFEAKQNANGFYDDEPLSGECGDDPEASCHLKHTKTQDLDETYDMIYQWRKVTEEQEFSDYTRILMTEAYTSFENNLRYYGRVENGTIVEYGSQVPFNFDLITRTNKFSSASEFKGHIEAWMNGMPKGKQIHANWVLGNHDQRRLASRYGPNRVDVFNILLKTLPGISITYYGEEIGMTDVFISWKDTQDPQACRTNPDVYDNYSRDPARTPMQWDNSTSAGFSTNTKTWLPLANNYTKNNVDLQESLGNSHLKIFRQLISLRGSETLKYGSLQVNAIGSDVLVYKRQIEGKSESIVVALNLNTKDRVVDLSANLDGIPKKLKVLITSIHSKGPTVGDIVNSKEVILPAEVGIVLGTTIEQN